MDKKKRVHKLERIYFWDYLICLILPLIILLIIPFLNSILQAKFVLFLGMGYGLLIITPYNYRLDIPKINLYFGCISLLLFAVGFHFYAINERFIGIGNQNAVTSLFYPLIMYTIFHIFTKAIKLITGTYPITVHKDLRVGQFFYRYKRKVSIWDFVWSIVWLLVAMYFLVTILATGRI